MEGENPPKKPRLNEHEPSTSASKSAKADEEDSAQAQGCEEDDDSENCTICMEPWTNSGEHRIASLKCGHFFGLACIERWLKSVNSHGCPNCNEKAQKRDIRVHFTLRLKAIDTSERDRALKDLAHAQGQLRQVQLDYKTLQVQNKLQSDEIEQLKRLCQANRSLTDSVGVSSLSSSLMVSTKGGKPVGARALRYVKQLDIIRSILDDSGSRDRYCRLMAFNEVHAMLIVTQPSFTALAPGFGIRRINMLDRKVGTFMALHKDSIRDMAFHPTRHDQLLSVSQDKSVRLTNVNSGQEIQRYSCDSEVWSCAWDRDNPHQFFIGTRRSEIWLYDTRETALDPKMKLEFPAVERRPIISLAYVQKDASSQFKMGGLLVMTLGSLWFFAQNPADANSYAPHRLKPSEPFWSMRFDNDLRLLLISTRPNPHSRHIVGSLTQIEVPESENQCSLIEMYNKKRGGSYTERSFLKACIFRDDQRAILVYGRGSSGSDHKMVLEELGTEKILQEVRVPRPILDIAKFSVNGEHFVAALCECQVFIYQWMENTENS
ncbi:hypothetical protein TCAL_00947 [Tigriopus californicus]|uniref:RING-type E3 ubiquitin transferase n=1 Tax=Tigriopus californicus TaxID=6832 RepID=A0A553P677_TIGCA|nr:E3 ubiquitin-protein ligase RFWD3-like [Tigriopus californicus]TRY73195.1 hypothetical protein TCAL_00947 [Tigriopus californicus]|eukprot:TCALIF_00947-PA protein Name:"Similar to RFWD3 E3 ubiquitin-protein ligase RFWD3 (Ailuropoda melanoleuca)" AED:0.00 eAED:0.00 QI:80/1/1/1/1/1/2/122/546